MLRLLPMLALLLWTSALPLPARAGPAWFDVHGPSSQVQEALDLLRRAAEYGLEPGDYNVGQLARAFEQATGVESAPQGGHAWLESALTEAMERYLSDLHRGRVKPGQVQANFARPARHDSIDLAATLREAVAAQQLAQVAEQLASGAPMSGPLLAALAAYRALQDDPAWTSPLPLPAGGKLVAGQPYRGLPELVRRLRALGDLDLAAAEPDTLDAVLTEALHRFQQRHGLVVDGVLGRKTLAELNVTPAQRARQIALTLERLRWTPYLQGARMVVVNLPEFVLRAYEVRDGQSNVKLAMKIIVGKALDTRTPLFDEDMRFIEFSPYWNVPRLIATRELIPRLRLEPAHFAEQGFEFVTSGRQVVATLSAAALEEVMQGRWRVRQRPGPRNALGDIKFIFPNNDNIYLHHTPAPRLFARERRDFSHGCIRVEAPVALARFVLQDDPDWSEASIRDAMQAGKSRTIRLAQPLPVLIEYRTVVIKQGMLHFFPDLYGHDAALDVALRQRSRNLKHPALPPAGGG